MSWDGKVNPEDEQYDSNGGGGGDRTRWCRAGRKILAPVGYERWSSSKNNPMLSVRFVCLDDIDGDASEVGAHVWRNFALTEAAAAFFARFARAMGYLSPFNVFKDEDVQAILAKGAVIGKVEEETYTYQGKEKTKSEVKFFDRNEGGWEPRWDEVCGAAEAEWDSYLEWREANPRGSKTNTRSGGSSSGGGGYGGQQSSLPPQDDDIPF